MKTLDELRDLAIRWALDYISHHQAQSRVNLDGIGSGLATAQRFEEESKRALDDALRELIADAEELRLRKKSGTAVDRLHNICQGIAADADGSEWSREEWERIDAENAELRKRFEWRPISTAPKDGTRVILSWGGTSCVGFFLDNSKSLPPWAGWRVPSLEIKPAGQPTHWLPLPSAPTARE